MVVDDEAFYFDDAKFAVGHLVDPGNVYTGLDPSDPQFSSKALSMRVGAGRDAAMSAQLTMLQDHGEDDYTNSEKSALLAAKESDIGADFGVFNWTHNVPFVFVEYPNRKSFAPTGNVLRLDCTSEESFLDSLHNLGEIELFSHQPEGA